MDNLEPVGLSSLQDCHLYSQCCSISHDLIPKTPGLPPLPNCCLLIYTGTEAGNTNKQAGKRNICVELLQGILIHHKQLSKHYPQNHLRKFFRIQGNWLKSLKKQTGIIST